MPELADVEGFRRYLARFAAGRRIGSVEVADPVLLRNTSPQGLGRAVRGRRFGAPLRHGKWLIAPVGRVEVLIHFGMTGLLTYSSAKEEDHPHDRLVFHLDEGVLRYRNMRRFGGVWLARSERQRREVTGPLGPDAMDVDAEQMEELVGGRRGGIKAALMDQKLMAGLGNLLCDEILWRARVDPRTAVRELSPRRLGRIHAEMEVVLRMANRRGRVPPDPDWLTGARGQRDRDCPRCGRSLSRATVAGRTTVWCPRCQRR